ncbi:MAG TPA: sigma-70 family RNA polymerase sigma factor [Chthoniobacteraceae bacterium]|nr:sigma-70 family RNA polymerase sigma factor [Chthoniobacteraceae bacterium]
MSDAIVRWWLGGWSLGENSRDESLPRLPGSDATAAEPESESPGHGNALRTPAHIGGLLASELLIRLRQGDREAFSHIYLTLRTPLWRLATILSGAPDVAEDLVQNVFLSVWMRRDQFSPDDDIQAYLRQAVRNVARQSSRHDRVVHHHAAAIQEEERSPGSSSVEVPAFDDSADRESFMTAYQHALTALTERQRVALQLRLEEVLTFESIGSLMGISKVAARKLVLAAEGKVRELLTSYGP